MSDNLRARIGAVQMAHMPDDYQRDMGECPCGFKYAKWSELASHVADAVIAELQLHQQWTWSWVSSSTGERDTGLIVDSRAEAVAEGGTGSIQLCRYVTDWSTDE